MTRRTRLTVVGLIVLIFLLLIAWFIYMPLSRGGEVLEVPEETTYEDVIEVPDEPVRATLSEQALETEQEERAGAASVISLSKTFSIFKMAKIKSTANIFL